MTFDESSETRVISCSAQSPSALQDFELSHLFTINSAIIMKYLSTALATLTLPILSLAQEPIFSNYFSTDSTLEGNFIRESFTTLVLPELNSPIGDSFLKIYPALYTNATASLSGTAQTIAEGLVKNVLRFRSRTKLM